MATINYWGLTGIKGSVTVTLSTDTFDTLITAIASDEGLATEYYTVTLQRNPSIGDIVYGDSSTVLNHSSIGMIDGDTVVCTPNQNGTKEYRQIQRLDIAQRKRTGGILADSTQGAYYRELNTYNRILLPTQYSGNDVINNDNSIGLIVGRPWSTTDTPGLISGLAIWYDTALTSTINGGTFSDGTTVTTLTNRATGTNGAAGSSGREPTVQNGVGDTLNGYPVVRFATAGSYDNIRFTTDAFDNATGWTVVMLAKTVITGGFNPTPFMITNSAQSSLTGIRYFGGSAFNFTTPVGSASVASNIDPDGTWKIITARYDSTAAVASRCTFRWAKTNITVTNGGTPPSGTVPDTATYVETMSAFDGDLAEQIAYNRALTDDEIIALEDYLSSKWGV